ncbi:BrnT family toxin [Candidatus Acetothermia bacterium]|nr:BrnT family toxin [Candidatus Acetothermia bacterium]
MRLEPPLIWEHAIAEKILAKHQVEPGEVEEIFFDDLPHFKGFQNVYHAYGQTVTGRYLFVVFRHLDGGKARPITAYEMTDKQQHYYRRVKGGS